MDRATMRAMLKGFGGGLVGAFVAGLALLWLGFYDSQPAWVTVITLVGAAVGTGIGFGLTERADAT
jgi:fructose-specific phosphotransferase system IIC component